MIKLVVGGDAVPVVGHLHASFLRLSLACIAGVVHKVQLPATVCNSHAPAAPQVAGVA